MKTKSITQSLNELVEDSYNIWLVELLENQGYRRVPAADESYRSFKVFKGSSPYLAGDVVSDSARFASFVNDHHSSCPTGRFNESWDWKRIDRSDVHELN